MPHKAPPQAPPFKPGKYRHYKGNFYTAICLVLNEADLQWMVLYRPLWIPEGDMWVRPLKEWEEPQVIERGACILSGEEMQNEDDCTTHLHEPDVTVPRFEFVHTSDEPWRTRPWGTR